MMDMYTYRADLFATPGFESNASKPDVTGWRVEALDGHIGHVDEATYEPGSSSLVVDTGFWIFGKRRMLPAGVVQRVDRVAETVHVGLTRDQIRAAPDYVEASHRGDTHYRRDLASFYDPDADSEPDADPDRD
jgi:hypothetical protein